MTKYAVLIIMLFLSSEAFSCSCSLGDVRKKFKESKYVFLGQVNSVDFTGKSNSLGDKKTIVKFSVSEGWKGDESEITLNTADNAVSCNGYWFEKNKSYLVYAYEKNGKLDTYYCGGVIPKSKNNEFTTEINELNSISK